MFCKLCKRTSDAFTHLCSNDYADQNTQCVIRNASRSIMLLTTHQHDSEIINKSALTKTCPTCGENKFPLHGRCKGFTFRPLGPGTPAHDNNVYIYIYIYKILLYNIGQGQWVSLVGLGEGYIFIFISLSIFLDIYIYIYTYIYYLFYTHDIYFIRIIFIVYTYIYLMRVILILYA